MALDKEDHARLQELKDEIKERLDEAMRMVRRHGGIEWERAKAYWCGNISTSLDDEGDFVGGPGHSMQNTIDELEPVEDDEEDEEV